MAIPMRSAPNCSWQGCSSIDDPQLPLTVDQAPVLPAAEVSTSQPLLRCGRCGVVYVPKRFPDHWRPRGFVVDEAGYEWKRWCIGIHKLSP